MKTITLAGKSTEAFIEEREKLLAQGATSPPVFSTQEEGRDEDSKVYVSMETFLRKKRHWDFGQVIDIDGTLIGISNYLFID